MFAIVEFKGNQYKVTEGSELKLPLFEARPGDKIVMDKLLLLGDDKGVKLASEIKSGKVEAEAYAILLKGIQDAGIRVFLVEMPFNLAVFDANAAEKIIEDNPMIKHWYIGGHSLGGAMASQFAEKHADRLDGLILLAAYPLNDAMDKVLLIAGSEDRVLDQTKLEGFDVNWIEGGNHANFAHYGVQKGDGEALIDKDEQIKMTQMWIIEFMNF